MNFDGVPVYYGGDLCDSDDLEDSEWEDPWNRVYVERYNLDALDGMELKVYERLWAGHNPVNMVGSPTTVHTLPNGHYVSNVAGSPVHRNCGVPSGEGVAWSCEGDPSDFSDLSDFSDTDCGSVVEQDRDTLGDWVDAAFRDRFVGFPPEDEDTQQPVGFDNRRCWDVAMAEPSCLLPTDEYTRC